MGKSSSGKDTVYRKLLEGNKDRLGRLIMYTTRPIRSGERDGEEYHFVDEACLQKCLEEDRVIELRSYNTVHGVWKYFTVKDPAIKPLKMDYLAIGTLESYMSTRDHFGVEAVVPIMIELDDGIRLERALSRERSQENPRYSEMCRRFLADEEDFSPEKMRGAGIERTFCNEDLEACLGEISAYIDSKMCREAAGTP